MATLPERAVYTKGRKLTHLEFLSCCSPPRWSAESIEQVSDDCIGSVSSRIRTWSALTGTPKSLSTTTATTQSSVFNGRVLGERHSSMSSGVSVTNVLGHIACRRTMRIIHKDGPGVQEPLCRKLGQLAREGDGPPTGHRRIQLRGYYCLSGHAISTRTSVSVVAGPPPSSPTRHWTGSRTTLTGWSSRWESYRTKKGKTRAIIYVWMPPGRSRSYV